MQRWYASRMDLDNRSAHLNQHGWDAHGDLVAPEG